MSENTALTDALEALTVSEGTALEYVAVNGAKHAAGNKDVTNVDATVREIMDRLAIFDGMEARIDSIVISIDSARGDQLATATIVI